MDNFGICGNEQFVDHLYRYGEINKEIKVKKEAGNVPDREMERDIEKCGVHRVTSLNICLTKIKSIQQGSEEWETYFNYIQSNHGPISDELQSFLLQPCMEKHRGMISACLQLINYVMDEFCKFTPPDEAIISEYKHVYEMISHSRRQHPKKVLLQAGKLFVNLVDVLTKRHYYKETTDIKFADIEREAGVIIDKLSAHLPHQAETVKRVNESFIELREMQDVYHAIQRDLLKKALKLAHARATESILQAAKRFVLDSISLVQTKLRDGLQKTIRIGEALVYPIMHPKETVKSVWYAIRHPVNTAKALWVWAKENPWKCGAIVAGGLCLGAFALGGAAILFDYFVLDITATILTPLLAGGACGGVIAPLAVAANRAQKLVKSAKDQIDGLESTLSTFQSDLEEKGEDIAEHALDEDLWVFLDGQETEAQGTSDQDINTMSEGELRQTVRDLNEQVPAIENELKSTQSVIDETTRDMLPDQQEASVIGKASEIMKKRIADANKANGPKDKF